MHELGVVFYVIRDVKKIAEENRVEQVESVTLEIGEVSGVLHEYLIDCWNWAVKKRTPDGTCHSADRDHTGHHLLRRLRRKIRDCKVRKDLPLLPERTHLSAAGK